MFKQWIFFECISWSKRQPKLETEKRHSSFRLNPRHVLYDTSETPSLTSGPAAAAAFSRSFSEIARIARKSDDLQLQQTQRILSAPLFTPRLTASRKNKIHHEGPFRTRPYRCFRLGLCARHLWRSLYVKCYMLIALICYEIVVERRKQILFLEHDGECLATY